MAFNTAEDHACYGAILFCSAPFCILHQLYINGITITDDHCRHGAFFCSAQYCVQHPFRSLCPHMQPCPVRTMPLLPKPLGSDPPSLVTWLETQGNEILPHTARYCPQKVEQRAKD